jgi:hypothetical protein
MKKVFLFLVAIIVFQQASYCMSKKEKTNNVNHKVWSNSAGIVVASRLDKGTYSDIEPVILEIEINNGSEKDIHFVVSKPFKEFKFEIRNKRNTKTVPLTLYGKKMMQNSFFLISVIKIKKGSKYTCKLNLKKYFDLSVPSDYSINIKGSYMTSLKPTVRSGFLIKELKFSRSYAQKI